VRHEKKTKYIIGGYVCFYYCSRVFSFSPLCINYKILMNRAYDSGGGLSRCDGVIDSNTIMDTIAVEDGGGVFECHAVIRNNDISYNGAS